MKRRLGSLLSASLWLAPAPALAQSPDVLPFLDLHAAWQVRSTKKSLFHWYDPTGRYALVGLKMTLETGHRVYVAQRLERVENSGDPDTVDEYYVESRGHWRLGKQYLPFGHREILRSTVLAARLDTRLLFDAAPVSVAACDGGSGRTRGVYARLGGPTGVSLAVGNHIGIQPTDLARFRDVESAPGIGRGYRLAFGADSQFTVGSSLISAEWCSLRRAERPEDKDSDFSDMRLRVDVPGLNTRPTVGWSRDWTAHRDFLSFEAVFPGGSNVSYVPILRLEGLAFRDFAMSVVVRF